MGVLEINTKEGGELAPKTKDLEQACSMNITVINGMRSFVYIQLS